MICPVCEKEGKKSIVRNGLSKRTLAFCPPYFDHDGNRHHHDRNNQETRYSCSEGHRFTVTYRGTCGCGWSVSNRKTYVGKELVREEQWNSGWAEVPE